MTVKIALAQLNLLVGDIEGNCQKIIDTAEDARDRLGADIVVYPELTLTGYPPEDLLYRSELHERVETALKLLVQKSKEVCLIIGYPRQYQGQLFNAVAVINNQEITHYYHKSALPNYSVFDEKRYFTSGDEATVFELKGTVFGLSICEDIWQETATEKARQAGAQVILNLNASPYVKDKNRQREALVSAQAKKHQLDIVYVNLVGGQDEVVFDGGSFACNRKGDLVQRSAFFQEQLSIVELNADGLSGEIINQDDDSLESNVYQALVLGVRDYVKKNGFHGVVLGLSGGIDSALTLAIAVDALGADQVEVVLMPSKYTADMSNQDAAQQAQVQNVKYSSIPIAPAFNAFLDMLADEFSGLPTDVTEENIQARCRGIILMAISNKSGRMLLTTGNKSEMAVGYATLYGDMNGGFAPIKDVPKTLVYRLSTWRNRDAEIIPQRVIDRPPSAELSPDQQDSDSLPDYDTLDAILEFYVEQEKSRSDILDAGFTQADVDRVLRLVDISEYKRRQAPPGVKITDRAFGRDRRYPITRKL